MADTRVLLESDTLHIGFFGRGKTPYPEDIVTPGVIRALAQHLRLDLGTQGVSWGDYCFFAGITGEAFRFLDVMRLDPSPEATRPLVERYGRMTVPEMYGHSLGAAGLDFHLYGGPDSRDEAALRHEIVHSLSARQTPVIGLGVFGPPEPFLITGYDEGGAVLLGWSHVQHEPPATLDLAFEPTGQFRLRGWGAVLDGAVIVTGHKDRPPLRDVYENALRRAIGELGVTHGRSGALGTAAIQKWAAYLETDANFAGLADEALKKAHSQHSATAGEHAERRALAGSFVELAARVLPDGRDDLAGAGAAFQGAHDTVYEIWETIAGTGPFDPDLQKFADPARRRTMAGLVRRLVEFDRRGQARLERAMRSVDGKPAGERIPPDPGLDGDFRLSKAPAAPLAGDAQVAPENVSLPNCMGMLRSFLGESLGELNERERAHEKIEYVLWMGYTGAAFGQRDDGPERCNLSLAFDALGYECELWLSRTPAEEMGLPCRGWGWDDNLRRRILWNLRDRGLPVLLFNCGPWPDWYLVTQVEGWWSFSGYGGGEGARPGEALDDPKNPLRAIDLLEGMKGRETWTANVTAKRSAARPSMEELCRRAVEWGAARLREPKLALLGTDGERFTSDAPYRDWAQMLRADTLFPPDDPAALRQRKEWLDRVQAELSERRFYGAAFLDLAAERLGRPELREAAGHMRAVHELVGQIWALSGRPGSPDGYSSYANARVRGDIADIVLLIEHEEREAAALLLH